MNNSKGLYWKCFNTGEYFLPGASTGKGWPKDFVSLYPARESLASSILRIMT
jgi:hypothetical protein